MEMIGYGILLAIGFYIAPVVLSMVLFVVALVFTAIGSFVNAIFGGNR